MKNVETPYKLYSLEKGNLPLPSHYLPAVRTLSTTILAGDIGGTNARFALFKVNQGELRLVKEKYFKTKEYDSLFELLKVFYTEEFSGIDSISLGVAGPVNDGKVRGTNFSWDIDRAEIIDITGIKEVCLINDMKAHAYGMGITPSSGYHDLIKGAQTQGNAVIISPGTGLGEAGLIWDQHVYYPVSSEGGHCGFAPRNELDIELWKYLHKHYGDVSWERIISGPGIYNLYKFLKEYRDIKEPQWFAERILLEDPAAVISNCFQENSYPICNEVINLFIQYLAVEASQLALKYKATGGVYIGGGITPRLVGDINKKDFKYNFSNSGTMKPLLDLIPVKVLLNPDTALYGAAIYAVINMAQKQV